MNLNLITEGLTLVFDLEGVFSAIASKQKPDLTGFARDLYSLASTELKQKYSNVTQEAFATAINGDVAALEGTLGVIENKPAS